MLAMFCKLSRMASVSQIQNFTTSLLNKNWSKLHKTLYKALKMNKNML